MKKSFAILFIVIPLLLVLIGCGTSTGSRYSKTETNKGIDSTIFDYPENNKIKVSEDFDITPYKTKIEVPLSNKQNVDTQNDIWYDYNLDEQNNLQKKLVGTEEGYRVLVVSSDNLEDVDKTKTDIQTIVDGNEIYTNFEPPFYKLKVGDFKNQNSADNLRFKLSQLGYKDAKVVRETINVFK